MSIDALRFAFRCGITNPGAKFVFVVLADFADERWSCYPSIETLSERTAIAYSTVRKHLDWLEAEGWLTRRKRKRLEDGYDSTYRFQLCEGSNRATAQIERSEDQNGAQIEQSERSNRARLTPNEPLVDTHTLSLARVRELGGDALADMAACPGIANLTPLKSLLSVDPPCTVEDLEDAVIAAAAWHRGKDGPRSMRSWTTARSIAIQNRDQRLAGAPAPNPNGGHHDRPAPSGPGAKREAREANMARAINAPSLFTQDRT